MRRAEMHQMTGDEPPEFPVSEPVTLIAQPQATAIAESFGEHGKTRDQTRYDKRSPWRPPRAGRPA